MPIFVFSGLLAAFLFGFIFGWGWAFVAALAVLVLWKIWPESDPTAPRDKRPAPPAPAAGGRGYAGKPADRRPAEDTTGPLGAFLYDTPNGTEARLEPVGKGGARIKSPDNDTRNDGLTESDDA